MKKAFLTFTMICSLAYALNSHAGLKTLTIHSRANCGNNESITWNARQSNNLLTWTMHYYYFRGRLQKGHSYDTDWQNTWRSSAVCWGEGTNLSGSWEVWGQHYIKNASGKILWLGDTRTKDCSIYNGWWDK